MILPFYRTVTTLAAPAIRLFLMARLWRGKEDHQRIEERFGRPGRPRPEGPLVWLHAASVGESISMLPLVGHLLRDRPEINMLVTTGTVSSAKLMAERLPPRAFHQYVPVDRTGYVRRFLDHWRPQLALWAESEFWPNLISETHARGIPMVLVNGRISPKSFAGWQKARGLIADLLNDFTLCLGQTEEDANRLRALGAKSYKCVGNLKFAGPPLPADPDELTALSEALDGRPRWLAASTHPGEEAIVAGTHRALRQTFAEVATILVPRHPSRGDEIARDLRARGLKVAQRSRGEPLTAATDIYLADTMGELGLFFRLADIAFMGKSLVPLGGQNPLEALRLDCAVLHGPHMANFQLIAEQMRMAGCAVEVANGAALTAEVARLLGDADALGAIIAAGRGFADTQAEVIDSVAAEIEAILENRLKTTGEHAGA